MRTTITLEADVAERLQQEMKTRGLRMKAVINSALRRGLRMGQEIDQSDFAVIAHDFAFKTGIDQDRLNQLVDTLEAEEFAARHSL